MLGQGLLSWKAALLSCSRVSCLCAWKIQGRSLSLAPVRTVNRNRSPRLKASGRQNNVGKGSRQNRSVTSGKGLALWVERQTVLVNPRSDNGLDRPHGWTGLLMDRRCSQDGVHWTFWRVERLTQNWYGQGESDCLIKTKHCEGAKACSRNVISAQCSECQREETHSSAGKRRE